MLASAQAKQPWNSTVPTLVLLPHCRTLRDIHQIHARLTTTGLLRNASLTAKLVLSLSSSFHHPAIEFARYLFFSQPHLQRYLIIWNTLIRSSFHGLGRKEAVVLFALMLRMGVCADKFSFSLALKSCSRLSLFREGLQIQCLIEKTELGSDRFLQNCLISFYSRCGYVSAARLVFDRMLDKDSVSWNSMIDGYVKCGMIDYARHLFDRMDDHVKDLLSWNSMISGYTQFEGGLTIARELFDQMTKKDLVSWNSMIDGYVKYGRLQEAICLFEQMPQHDVITWVNLINGFVKSGSVDIARWIFDKMPERDVVAWNIMISSYVHNGRYSDALLFFEEMRTDAQFAPDETTLVAALSAAAELGRLEKGLSLHDYIKRNGLSLDDKLGVALIDMYSKCGRIEKAKHVFRSVKHRQVEHWNAMINGLAIHGLGESALHHFKEMVMLSFKPDDITFIGILSACSHSGLVEEGLLCFDLMQRVHNVMPKVQHYGCLVDILGRAGMLEEARKVIEEMPVQPNDVVWRALLSACKNHDNFDIGYMAAKQLLGLDPCCSSAYVLLSDLYAATGMWGDVSGIRNTMKEKTLRKIPGCSWIELDGIIHEFVVCDRSHPQSEEIFSVVQKFKVCASGDLDRRQLS